MDKVDTLVRNLVDNFEKKVFNNKIKNKIILLSIFFLKRKTTKIFYFMHKIFLFESFLYENQKSKLEIQYSFMKTKEIQSN